MGLFRAIQMILPLEPLLQVKRHRKIALLSPKQALPDVSMLKVGFIPTSVRAAAHAKTPVISDLKIFPR